jgi:predicted  nucleic acid-binding Zn-ribbon protein
MATSLFRVKRYSHPKYKFVVRAKIGGAWRRRYFSSESEAMAFATEANAGTALNISSDAPETVEVPEVQVPPPARAAGPDLSGLTGPVYLGPRIQRYIADAWCMHLPFAYDLMREFAPKTFVELGVKEGESYFAFCQSAAENKISVRCYGVDSWRGDIQTGKLSPEIAKDVAAYNWQYSSFSELKQMLFAEALGDFADGSIDLLHIDGAHTYNDVKTDFESWLPKVSPNGLVLFHDVMVRDHGFGVWKVWEEIARDDNSFLFEFGFGLGVWKKQPVATDDPPFIRSLFRADVAERRRINESYATAAAALALWENAARHFPATNQDPGFSIEAAERTTEIARFRRESERQKQEMAEARRALEEMEGRFAQLQRELAEKNRRIAELEAQQSEHAGQLAEAERQAAERAKHAAQLQRELDEKSRQASGLERDAGKVSQQLAVVRQENAALHRERDKLAQSVMLLKGELAAAEERLEQASLEVLESQWESLTLRRDLTLQSEPAVPSAQVLELESRIAVAESERNHLRTMVSALQKDLDAERSRIETLEPRAP